MKLDQSKEKVRHKRRHGRRRGGRGRKEIILKKVIISAREFAVAPTTNKAELVGRCAQQRRLKRGEKASGE